MNIFIGVPVNKRGSYIIDIFLKNQEDIVKGSVYPIKIVFASEESGFLKELTEKLSIRNLHYFLLPFNVVRPEGSTDRIWGITQAREAIRNHAVRMNADALIFLDCDMVYDIDIVNKLLEKMQDGFDVVYNSYLLKNGKLTMNGFGGTLINKKMLAIVPFRCYESNTHDFVIDEGTYFEMDLLKNHANIFRGIIVNSIHYCTPDSFLILKTRRLFVIEKLKFSTPVRKIMSKFVEKRKMMIIFVRIGYFLYRHF